ncbi:transposase, partial [Shigella dysenteriae]
ASTLKSPSYTKSVSWQHYSYPVSTTGKLPAAGDYSGIATIHVELE